MSYSCVYTTCSSQKEAEYFAEQVVLQHLAACVHIYSGIQSYYIWQGDLQKEAEYLVSFKTHSNKVDALITWLESNHSYDCPCVLSWPITKGSPAYLTWIDAQTIGQEDVSS